MQVSKSKRISRVESKLAGKSTREKDSILMLMLKKTAL